MEGDVMHAIRSTCPECWETIEIDQKTVRVDIYPNDTGTYTFTCPECNKLAIKPAMGAVRHLLEAAVDVEWVRHYAPPEAREPKVGPALTLDDVNDFIIEIHRTPDHLIPILAGGER